ncbi:MAG: hypothetical protein AAFQ94_23725 [Bacteroidota bacterium]
MKIITVPFLLITLIASQVNGSTLIQGDSVWIETSSGCKVYNPFPAKNESVTWSGGCSGGFASGEGELIWSQKGTAAQKYTGSMKRGMPSGYGIYDLMNGTIKEGNYQNGKQNGLGKYYSIGSNDKIDHYVEGNFVDGELLGIGIEIYFDEQGDSSIYYKGSFVDENWEGQGTLKYFYEYSFTIYKGTFKNDAPAGMGEQFEYFSGKEVNYKKGIFPFDKMNGKGEVRVGLNRYLGEFKKGKREGQGKLINNKVLVYEGEWRNDKIDGIGKRYFPDGSFYMGKFKQNEPNGFGVKDWGDGYMYIGEFHNGLFEGNGVVFKDTRVLASGIWAKGEVEYQRDYQQIMDKINSRYKETIESMDLNVSFLVNN